MRIHLASIHPLRTNRAVSSLGSCLKDKIFTYGFDVGKDGVEDEWLVAFHGGRETL